MKKVNLNSIRSKIVLFVSILLAVCMGLLGVISICLNMDTTKKVLLQAMQESASLAGDRIGEELHGYVNITDSMGAMPEFSSEDVPVSEKKKILDMWIQKYSLSRGNILTAEGESIFNGKNFADREYFQEAITGKSYVSTPVVSKETGNLTILVASPIWENGVVGSKVVGVVYIAPKEEFLTNIIASIQVSKNGASYVIDKNGTTIADKNLSVIGEENIESMAQSNSKLEKLAAIHGKMRAGENGSGTYKMNHEQKFIAYAPVSYTDGWSVAINAPTKDFMGATYVAISMTILAIIIGLAVAIMIAGRLARNITRPIHLCTERIKILATGDVTSPVPDIQTKDETKVLADATVVIVNGLHTLLGDMKNLLHEMANKNFDIRSESPDVYIGDFEPLLLSIREINHRLSSTMAQINQSSDQVSAGANQVSDGAQALAQGATEQASTIEELSASLSDIAQSSKRTAEMASDAKNSANNAGSRLESNHRYLADLSDSMDKIHTSSEEIRKIIATIENIAFQTNILALNAAVEAARAGNSGKGFAVVADEVRMLANKSDEAAKATKALIEKSIAAVQEGVDISSNVTTSMGEVMELAKAAVKDMEDVADAVAQQNDAISQITTGVDQISSVVQTNSATAEESAAASEELSGQAAILKELVSEFVLRTDSNTH